MQAEVESIFAGFYFALFFICLVLFVMETTTGHIRIKAFITFYSCEFHRKGYITWKLSSKNHVSHVVSIEAGYSATNLGKQER